MDILWINYWVILDISRNIKKLNLIPIILLILFGGFDLFGFILSNNEFPSLGMHIEWWAIEMQYSSMTTLLYWTPHMFIPALIMTPFLLYTIKDSKKMNIILFSLMTCTFFWSPFVLIGLLPYFCYCFYRYLKTLDNKLKLMPMSLFIHCILLGIVLILFILSNRTAINVSGFLGDFVNLKLYLPVLILFYFLEFGISSVFILIFKIKKENYIPLYISIICLILIPFYYMGYFNDFVMRVSIPSLIIILLYLINVVTKNLNNWKNLFLIIIFIFLISFSSINEIARAFIYDCPLLDKWGSIANSHPLFTGQYISNDDNNIFNKYILKDI